MNREIVELREVITKLVPLLAGRGLKVTQRGSQAYVNADPVTKKPVSVNIPNISDNASPDFIRAIQGFIDHEVAHVLYTDWNHYCRGASAADLKKPEVQRFMNTHNIVEDTMIERRMVEDFPGSSRNLSDTRRYFLERITKKALETAKNDKEAFIYLLVPTMRALAGQQEMQDFMDDGGYWKNPFVKGVVEGLKPDTLQKLKKARSTIETLEIAEELHAILYPPQPPAPPMPSAPSDCDDEGQDSDSSSGSPSSSKKSKDKPEKKADEGDGDGERDHQESGEEGTSKDKKGKKDKSKKDDKSDEEKEEGAGDKGDDEDAGDGEEEQEADGSGKEDEDGEGSDAGDDDGESDAGDEGEEEDDGKGKDKDSDGDDEEGGSGGEGDDESEDADEGGDDEDGEDGSGAPGKSGDKGGDSDEEGKNKAPEVITEGADGGGVGEMNGDDTENSPGGGVSNDEGKSLFDFDDDAFEEADMSKQIAILISDEAVEAMDPAEYLVYTREFDRIEPVNVPDKMDSTWVPKMEEEVRLTSGRLQKDIERMLASQSHVIRTPGHKKGKLHAPSLYRVMQGDPRVFTQKQEHVSKDTAVTLLCDNSGSMGGAKMKLGMISSYALAVTLERVKISYEVLGFTTGNFSRIPNSILEAMQDEVAKTGLRYDRIEPINMPIYKDFDERLDARVKARFAYMMFAQRGLNGNIDGESLEYAAMRLMKRPEKRKVMIVLSDGQPAGSWRSGPHLKTVVERLNKTGIETVGIGIMDRSVARYYDKHVVITKLDDLPGSVMGELKRILT